MKQAFVRSMTYSSIVATFLLVATANPWWVLFGAISFFGLLALYGED